VDGVYDITGRGRRGKGCMILGKDGASELEGLWMGGYQGRNIPGDRRDTGKEKVVANSMHATLIQIHHTVT
jgi:hypothetical protein